MIPGEIIAAEGDITWLPDRGRTTVAVLNTGDRPIQVGSPTPSYGSPPAKASIPTPQPVFGRPMFAATGSAAAHHSVTFVAPRALEDGLEERLGLQRALVPVRDTRAVRKADLPLNDATPEIAVDAETFTVSIDGEPIVPQPVDELPLAQRYSLF